MKSINIHYPYIKGNSLCDGKTHIIEPIKLEELETNLYILHYYDLDHKTSGITLLRRHNNEFRKIPLKDYNQLFQLIHSKNPLRIVTYLLEEITDIYSDNIVNDLAMYISDLKTPPVLSNISEDYNNDNNNSIISSNNDDNNIDLITTTNSENVVYVVINLAESADSYYGICDFGNIYTGLPGFISIGKNSFKNIGDQTKNVIDHLINETNYNRTYINNIKPLIIENTRYEFVGGYKQIANATNKITSKANTNEEKLSLVLAMNGNVDSLCFGTIIIEGKLLTMYNIKQIKSNDIKLKRL